MTDLDRPAAGPERLREPLAERRPGPGLGDEDRPSRLEPPQRGPHGVGRDALAHDQLADAGLGAEERRPGGRPGRRQPLRGVHDAADLGEAVDPPRGPVEALAGRGELPDPAQRVAARDERPDGRGSTEPLGQHLRAHVEPDRDPAAVERPPVARVHHGAAAGRDHAPDRRIRVRAAERRDRLALETPEGGLAVLREDLRDAPAGRLLDPLVEVDERGAVAVRQAPPDGGLAGPRQPDEDDVHGAASGVRGRRVRGEPSAARPGRRRPAPPGPPACPPLPSPATAPRACRRSAPGTGAGCRPPRPSSRRRSSRGRTGRASA